MNDKQAHAKLKALDRQRNLVGVGGYRNSRRSRSDGHEAFCKTMKEADAVSDRAKLKGDSFCEKN